MREIKFRAWDKKKKEYFHISEMWNGGTDPCCFSADGWVDNYGNRGNIKDIVMEQYVGLHDKNGNEIYEGDIIKYTSEDDVFFYAEVKYFADDDNYPAFDFIPPDEDWQFQSNCLSEGSFSNALEVVGNIHQNADLLEAE
jgi:uncharacterized phage protein (TIGR01671 family)